MSARSFHLALAIGVVPFAGLPFAWQAALAGRDAADPADRAWSRRALILAVADSLIAALALASFFFGTSPQFESSPLLAPGQPPRIGLYADHSASSTISGAHVGSVLPDSPAADAYLEPGDIIVAVDGRAIATFAELAEAIAAQPSGTPRKLRVLRPSDQRTIELEKEIIPGDIPDTPANAAAIVEAEAEQSRARTSRGLFEPWAESCFLPSQETPWGWATTIIWGVMVLLWIVALVLRSSLERALRWTAVSLIGAAIGGLGAYAGMCTALSGPTRAGIMASIILQPAAMFAVAFAGKRALDANAELEARFEHVESPAKTYALALLYTFGVLIRLAVVLAFVRELAPSGFGGLAGPRDIGDMYGSELGDPGGGRLALAFAAVLIAPFAEEYLFRGILLPGLAQRLPAIHALALSSLVFALMHSGTHRQFVGVILILGWMLGWARLKSGGLAAPIALHATINLIAVLPVLAASI